MAEPATELDPITLSVMGGAFKAIAKQMAQVLYRMSYSSIIRESEDLGCGIFFADGAELCESDTTPMHVGSIPGYLEGIISVVGDDIHDGDVFLHNDPYLGASHTPDLCIAIPIFYEGKHCAWACANGHVADVGGMSPGLMVHTVDVWAEGHHYTALRIESKGVRNEELWKHIWQNTRTATWNRGDTEAMIAASPGSRPLPRADRQVRLRARLRGRRVLARLLRAHDPPRDRQGAGRRPPRPHSVARRRRRAHRGAAAHRAGDRGGGRAHQDRPDRLQRSGGHRVQLPVLGLHPGDRLLGDPLDPARRGDPPDGAPQNSGIFRSIEVVAPLGSIFNPVFPASCTARINQVTKMADSMNLAMADVYPERICAGSAGHTFFVSYSGLDADRGEYWVYLEVNETSYGGRFGKDGMDAVDCMMANTRNNPIEELELRNPMLCVEYELRPGPGAGRWRGGMGIVRTWECLTDTLFSGEGDGATDAARASSAGATA